MAVSYGLTDKGFLKKPYEVIKEELEAKWIKIFGSTINLEPQSPQGQIIAITAESIYDVWEQMERVFSSFNIDDVGGLLLNHRSQLRGFKRFPSETDEALRVRLKEVLPNSVLHLRDELRDELMRLENVEDVEVKYKRGITEAFVMGGDELTIAKTILDYMPPGTFEGNVTVPVDRVCDGVKFYRPKFIFISLKIEVERFMNLECECREVDETEIAKSIVESACGLGYGEWIHIEYIKNIIASFKGFKIKNIELKRSEDEFESRECIEGIKIEDELCEVLELEKWQRVVLCPDMIDVQLN